MNFLTIKITEQDRKLVSDFMGEDYPIEIDFNWLMPVVKKAYDIYLNERGSKYIAEFILTSKYECFWEIKIVSPIEYVWPSVVEFIKWHNQQK